MILKAYRQGWFPMGEPDTGRIEWYEPDSRAILPLDEFHCPRRLARTVKSGKFEVCSDRDFAGVMDGCADRTITWITDDMRKAYLALHREGRAHSVEAWQDGRLAGGLYGVHLGGAFMAESMFHRVTDAGKVALVALVIHLRAWGFSLLDVQMMTPNLRRFGAILIPREEYLRRLRLTLRRTPNWGRLVSCQPPGLGSQ